MWQRRENERETGGDELLVQLIAELPPQVRKALENPVRRRILRALNNSEIPRTSIELASASTPASSISIINYHALVLAGCGSIKVTGTQPIPGNVTRLYASNVAGDRQIASVLQASRQLDRDHLN